MTSLNVADGPGCVNPPRGSTGPGRQRRAPQHAIRLPRVVAARAPEAPEHAPGAAGREQPVGLAAENAEKALRETLPREVDVPGQVRAEAFDDRLRHDAAHPDREEERQSGR